jgi:hypothetical protein
MNLKKDKSNVIFAKFQYLTMIVTSHVEMVATITVATTALNTKLNSITKSCLNTNGCEILFRKMSRILPH